MPDIVKMMLKENGLDEAYANRPPVSTERLSHMDWASET